jgi:hypothetical protein
VAGEFVPVGAVEHRAEDCGAERDADALQGAREGAAHASLVGRQRAEHGVGGQRQHETRLLAATAAMAMIIFRLYVLRICRGQLE